MSPHTRQDTQADQTGASFAPKLSQVQIFVFNTVAVCLYSRLNLGMGTVPLPNGGRLQTWDGVVSGDRLLTMACSDKLLAWNVVGLQGALLSHWLEPVYLSSLTLGSKYIPEHVERALHGRLGHFLPLPPPHRVAMPALLGTTSPETRQPTKAQEFSANWIAGR